MTWPQRKVLDAIVRCRTAALGGHRDQCKLQGRQAISCRSCRNRHCPKCQTGARDRWLAKRQQELLDVGYYHLVFSVPHELVPLMWQNKRQLFSLLFKGQCCHTLLDVAADSEAPRRRVGISFDSARLGANPHSTSAHPLRGAWRATSHRTTLVGSLRIPAFFSRSRYSVASFEVSSSLDLRQLFARDQITLLRRVRPSLHEENRLRQVPAHSFIGNQTGLCMLSRLSAAPTTCCTIWLATRIVSPSPTISYFHNLCFRGPFSLEGLC